MNQLNRRSFIQKSATAGAVFSISKRSWAQIPSASEEIRVGVVGFRGRGQSHIDGLGKLENVRIAGLCDVDEAVLMGEAKKWKDQGREVEAHRDIRRLIDSKEIDAISIATPNHWHSLAAIWAIQAGKDVYVEKPVSHNVWEGRQLVKAARQHKKIVQTGTQSRSSRALRECFAWLKEGNLGKIKLARGLCYKPRPSIGKVDGPQPIPEGVDYDLWCGPAPMAPLMRKNLHYDWHWDWDTGNGDLGNQGIHQMDIARWALGINELSPRIFSFGGRLGYIDDGETPNTQVVYHDYPEAPLIFEVRGLPRKKGDKEMPEYRGVRIGVVLHCEGGDVVIPGSNAKAYDKDGMEIKSWSGSDDHFANFIKAVRSRNPSDLNADILEGHLSSALCHTGNVSYLTGQEKSSGELREEIKGNSEALESFGRMAEHLQANEVNLENTKITMGAFLKMNPTTERFTNNDRANKLLTRDYRKPYVVPEKV